MSPWDSGFATKLVLTMVMLLLAPAYFDGEGAFVVFRGTCASGSTVSIGVTVGSGV